MNAGDKATSAVARIQLAEEMVSTPDQFTFSDHPLAKDCNSASR